MNLGCYSQINYWRLLLLCSGLPCLLNKITNSNHRTFSDFTPCSRYKQSYCHSNNCCSTSGTWQKTNRAYTQYSHTITIYLIISPGIWQVNLKTISY